MLDNVFDPDAMEDDEELNINPLVVVDRDDIPGPHHDTVVENAKDDYEFTRRNLKQIIETNVKALERLAKLAGESDSPRTFEVMSSFMKQMTEANASLMEMHKKVKDITQETGGGSGESEGGVSDGGTVQMSTEALLDMLEAKEKRAQEDARTIEGEVEDVES